MRPREIAVDQDCIAFQGSTCVAFGSFGEVAGRVKRLADADRGATVLVFDTTTSEPIEIDLRGSVADVLARIEALAPHASGAGAEAAPATSGVEQAKVPGRPRLGVVAREVTLLPRHWDWLSEQPGGASVTLRKLVEEARRATAGETRIRRAREACYRFMNTMAGNEPGFEEALRALFAGDAGRFAALTEEWPVDVRDHARRLAAGGFPGEG
jgi:uncharacterized protein